MPEVTWTIETLRELLDGPNKLFDILPDGKLVVVGWEDVKELRAHIDALEFRLAATEVLVMDLFEWKGNPTDGTWHELAARVSDLSPKESTDE